MNDTSKNSSANAPRSEKDDNGAGASDQGHKATVQNSVPDDDSVIRNIPEYEQPIHDQF